MIRVVLDANVIASALVNPQGTPAQVLDAWRAAHPREPTDDRERRWQLRDRLYLDSLKPYLRAHILRERLAEAERTPQDREDNARPHVRDLCG